MENYMQDFFYSAFINGSPADHTYVKLFKNGKEIDRYVCFSPDSTGGEKGNYSKDNLDSSKIQDVLNYKGLRGTSDSTRMIYGVNGVCHQAANRFLHHSYITMVQDYDYRPKGLNTSYFIHGEYGNIANQYKHWRKDYYNPACEKYHYPIDMDKCDQSTPEGHLWYKCELNYRSKKESASYIDDILYETEAVLSLHFPTLTGNPISETQRAILQERENFMETLGIYYSEESGEMQLPVFTKEIIKQLVDKTNDLSKQIQSELKSKIGETDFVLVNGAKEYLNIANLDMAYSLLLK